MAWIKRPAKKRRTDTQRRERMRIYNDARWRHLRESYRRRHPLCERCAEMGVITPGEDVHHIRSFMEGKDEWERQRLAFDEGNLRTLCKRCHREMHHHHDK